MKASLARDFDQLEDLAESVDYAVVGPHDNRVHEVRTRIFPFNTICHLERDFGDGIWRGCTATLISPLKALRVDYDSTLLCARTLRESDQPASPGPPRF
jgi:V8-like Glu-specific endopeptidase